MVSTGELIRAHRAKLGITQQQFADQNGLTRILVAKTEQGWTSPRLATLRVLARALGVPLGDLLDDDSLSRRYPKRRIVVEGDIAYVPLSKGAVAIIDAKFAEAVQETCSWILHSKGYAWGRCEGGERKMRARFLHHFIWKLEHGKFPEDELDHRDHNRLDCRLSNLRLASHAQNMANLPYRVSRMTGYKGVRRVGKKFGAEVTKDGKRYWLGVHVTAESAARTYDAMAMQLFGEFASINFPDEPRTETA